MYWTLAKLSITIKLRQFWDSSNPTQGQSVVMLTKPVFSYKFPKNWLCKKCKCLAVFFSRATSTAAELCRWKRSALAQYAALRTAAHSINTSPSRKVLFCLFLNLNTGSLDSYSQYFSTQTPTKALKTARHQQTPQQTKAQPRSVNFYLP